MVGGVSACQTSASSAPSLSELEGGGWPKIYNSAFKLPFELVLITSKNQALFNLEICSAGFRLDVIKAEIMFDKTFSAKKRISIDGKISSILPMMRKSQQIFIIMVFDCKREHIDEVLVCIESRGLGSEPGCRW